MRRDDADYTGQHSYGVYCHKSLKTGEVFWSSAVLWMDHLLRHTGQRKFRQAQSVRQSTW